ncbi:MAG TPA: choice-of-anchor X domain-containing protein, partial [Pyrinomonadaceae bacterium]|nr:choice-of-anchor X domain-containing protein [Pyrinomonadaceae bacterium]
KEVETETAQVCEVWSGTIQYKQHRAKTETKVTNKGEHISDQHYTGTHITKSSYDYNGTFNVVSSSGNTYEDGSKSIKLKGAMSADVMRVMDEKDDWKTETNCFPDKPNIRVAGRNSTSNITASGKLAKTSDDGWMNIKGSEFKISFAIPRIEGTRVHKTTMKPFGWCLMDKNPPHDSTHESTETFDSEHVQIEGTLDPKNQNVITGSVQPDTETTITWNLTRTVGECGDEGKLKVEGLKLEHHVFPNPTAWQEIGGNTIDGNQVKITATVSNSSKKAKSGTVAFKETTSGEVLGTQPVSVPGGGETEVEFLWDTNGFAWTDARGKMPNRRIEADLSNGEKAEADVKVYPKPVILVHGLWSNAAAWSEYPGYLAELHSFAWRGFAVGADPAHGKMNTGEEMWNSGPTNSIFQNAQELGKQIKFTQESMNAWRVDIVAHSMGGLISRFYIHSFMRETPDGKPVVNRLVMLGTPNMGSPWADIMFDKYKRMGKHVEALNQLRTEECARFNQIVTNRKGVKFSIVYTDTIPVTGDTFESGDGVVSRSSAIWQITDISHSSSFDHTSLTGKEDFLRYVYPRLAVGPKTAKQRAALLESSPTQEMLALNRIGENWVASLDPKGFVFLNNEAETAPFPQTERGKMVALKPNQTIEIEIPAARAKSGGISFATSPNVSAILHGANGEVIAESRAGSPEANGYFRYILIDNPINGETWKLKLENRDDKENLVFYAAVFDTNPFMLEFVEIQKQADGTVKMQAAFTNNGAAVKGAAISVKINKQTTEIALADDGKHGDGQANDGVYGATTGKLAAGEHFIEAKAAINGASATATATLSIHNVNQ